MKTRRILTMPLFGLLLFSALPASAQRANTDFRQAVADYQKSQTNAFARRQWGGRWKYANATSTYRISETAITITVQRFDRTSATEVYNRER
jgi:hypothetical protein